MDHEDGDGDGAGLDGGVDGDSGGGMDEPSGGDSGSVSPSDLLRRQPSVSCFVVFVFLRRLPYETPRGTIFIVVFRSRRRHGDEDRRHWRLEAQVGGSHAVKESDRVGPPLSALGFPFVRFLRSYTSFLPKTDAREILGHLGVGWVPESQKDGKRGFLVLQG